MTLHEVFNSGDVEFNEEYLIPMKITHSGEWLIKEDDIWEEISAIEVIE